MVVTRAVVTSTVSVVCGDISSGGGLVPRSWGIAGSA